MDDKDRNIKYSKSKLRRMRKANLIEIANSLGISISGTKAELIERILKATEKDEILEAAEIITEREEEEVTNEIEEKEEIAELEGLLTFFPDTKLDPEKVREEAEITQEESEEYRCPSCYVVVSPEELSCPECGLEFDIGIEPNGEIGGGIEEGYEEKEMSLVSRAGSQISYEVEVGRSITNEITEREPDITDSLKKVRRGLINGLTNGLTNGLRAISSGWTNGITNGNGIINGLGGRQDIVEGKKNKWRIVVMSLFVCLLILSPYLLFATHTSPDLIIIDGRFGDWKGVETNSDEDAIPPFNSNVDIIDYGVDDRHMELSFYLEVEENILNGEPGGANQVDTAYIFIDTDQNPDSGYLIKGIGADYMIEVYGWDGRVLKSCLHSYTSEELDWNYWKQGSSIASAAFGSQLEVKVSYQKLDLRKHNTVDVLFYMQSYDGYEDFSDTIICNEKGILIVEQQGCTEGNISDNSNQMLRLNLRALNADIILEEMDLVRRGKGSDGDVREIRLMDKETVIAKGTLSNGAVNFETELLINQGENKTLFIEVDVSDNTQAGSSIGLRVMKNHDIIINKGTITLRNFAPQEGYFDVSYISSTPWDIIVDGAFADWEEKEVKQDNGFEVSNKNLEIIEYAVTNTTDTVSFYLRVDGKIGWGTEVPHWNDARVPVYKESGEPKSTATPPPEPPKTGEDLTYIYIDRDNTLATGYYIGGIGADQIIEIKGKYGKITSSRHLRFAGIWNFDWKWADEENTFDAEIDTIRLETKISKNSLKIEGHFKVYFQTTDWSNKTKDYSDESLHIGYGRSGSSNENPDSNEEDLELFEDIQPLLIRLRAGTFDPLTEEPDVDQELVTDSPTGYYILQFNGPIQKSWKENVCTLGGKFYGYIPDYAFIIGFNDTRLDDVKNLPFVRWVGIYQPAYKVQEGLLNNNSDEVNIDVLIFKNKEKVESQIENLNGVLQSESDSKLRISINETKIRDLLFVPEVEWIEETPTYRLSNNVSDDLERLNVNLTWGDPYYLNGTGQIVGVCDTGLDTGVNDSSMHDDFEGRIVALYDLVGGSGETAADMNSGHGTHVAGSVLGNGTMSSGEIKGMAYCAQLVFQAVEDDQSGALSGIPLDLNDLFQQAYNDSARIHTNSWGSDVSGQYTSDSQYVDEFTWANRDMVILFSAGNDGIDSNSDGIVDLDSLESPATGKNCISVGASENYRSSGGYEVSYGTAWPSDFPADPIDSDLMSNNSNGMVAFSSRGSTDDGRIKPDVIAPGTNVLSTNSSVSSGNLWGVYDDYYVYSGGTSMSTPLVAGCAALVRQYYIDHEELTAPSGALIKATLINGATDISGQYGSPYNDAGPIPNFNEGWGRVNLTNSIFPPSPRNMTFEDIISGFTASDQNHTYTYPIAPGEPLKITLVWTDYPGTPTSGGLVNDLNLNVTAPNGTTYYYGNNFDNGWSNEDHTFDDTNNVECVYIQSPSGGTYTVEITAQNIAELGSQSDQEYALVVSGNFQFDNDVGVENLYVNRTQLKDTQAEIKATIKNFGSNNQNNPFDVRCVITNPQDTEVLNETRTVNSLTSLSKTNKIWYYTPTILGQYTISVRTELSTDEYDENNASSNYMMVPLVLSKLVSMTGTNANDLFGFNVTMGRLNNDDYRDIIVGAPGANNAYVFYGNASMNGSLNAADADEVLIGPDPDSGFGWSVGVADVTGDGYDDIIVGAPEYNGNQGRAYIYHSSAVGLLETFADAIITGGSLGDRFGNSVSGAGEVNNADNEDVIIGAYLNDTISGSRADAGMAYIFFGTSSLIGSISVTNADVNLTGIYPGDHFGFSVSSASNTNNDAYDDIIVGAPRASKAYFYYGGPNLGEGGYSVTLFEDGFESGDFTTGGWNLSSPPPVVTDDHPNTGVYAAGGSIAIFGYTTNTYTFQKNIDTTSYEDIVVSYYVAVEDAGPGTISFVASYSTDNGQSWTDFEGAVTDTNDLYLARTWDLSSIRAANDNPNFIIKFAGTFGGPVQSPSNAFWVDDVNVNGTVIPGSAIANVTLIGEDTNDNFGWSVGSCGNVNGDPYYDFVIGAPDYDSSLGRAYVFFGGNSLSSSIPASDANVTINGARAGDKFGYSVGGADLGTDGYSDILVGAPYNDTIDGSKSDAGAIYIINGSSSMAGVIDAANCTKYGERANDHFGWSVSNALDVNDDNYGDVIVGAPHYDSYADADAGKAYVLTVIPEYPDPFIPIIGLFLILAIVRLKSKKQKINQLNEDKSTD